MRRLFAQAFEAPRKSSRNITGRARPINDRSIAYVHFQMAERAPCRRPAAGQLREAGRRAASASTISCCARSARVPRSLVYRILRTGRGAGKRPTRQARLSAGRGRSRAVAAPAGTRGAAGRPSAPKAPSKSLREFVAAAVIHEDRDLIVVNKPAGVAVHGGSGVSFGVIEALRAVHPELKELELVHRLDRETSGCLLVAKRRAVLRELHAQLRERDDGEALPGAGRGALAVRRQDDRSAAQDESEAGRRARGARPQRRAARGHDVQADRAVRQARHAARCRISAPGARTRSACTPRTPAIRSPATRNTAIASKDAKLKPYGLSRMFLHAASLTFRRGERAFQRHCAAAAGFAVVLESCERAERAVVLGHA